MFFTKCDPIPQRLLCCRLFAVKHHSFIPCASHLQRPRLVNKPSLLDLFIKNIYQKHNLMILYSVQNGNRVSLRTASLYIHS